MKYLSIIVTLLLCIGCTTPAHQGSLPGVQAEAPETGVVRLRMNGETSGLDADDITVVFESSDGSSFTRSLSLSEAVPLTEWILPVGTYTVRASVDTNGDHRACTFEETTLSVEARARTILHLQAHCDTLSVGTTEVTVDFNARPVIVETSPIALDGYSTCYGAWLWIAGYDPEDSLSFTWSADGPGSLDVEKFFEREQGAVGQVYSSAWVRASEPGDYDIQVEVRDNAGGTATQILPVTFTESDGACSSDLPFGSSFLDDRHQGWTLYPRSFGGLRAEPIPANLDKRAFTPGPLDGRKGQLLTRWPDVWTSAHDFCFTTTIPKRGSRVEAFGLTTHGDAELLLRTTTTPNEDDVGLAEYCYANPSRRHFDRLGIRIELPGEEGLSTTVVDDFRLLPAAPACDQALATYALDGSVVNLEQSPFQLADGDWPLTGSSLALEVPIADAVAEEGPVRLVSLQASLDLEINHVLDTDIDASATCGAHGNLNNHQVTFSQAQEVALDGRISCDLPDSFCRALGFKNGQDWDIDDSRPLDLSTLKWSQDLQSLASEPIEIPSRKLGQAVVSLNGRLVSWVCAYEESCR